MSELSLGKTVLGSPFISSSSSVAVISRSPFIGCLQLDESALPASFHFCPLMLVFVGAGAHATDVKSKHVQSVANARVLLVMLEEASLE